MDPPVSTLATRRCVNHGAGRNARANAHNTSRKLQDDAILSKYQNIDPAAICQNTKPPHDIETEPTFRIQL